MSYPSTFSSFNRPSATDKLNSPSHSALHNTVSSALGQVEAVIGLSGDSSTLGTLIGDLRSPGSDGGGHIQTANKGGTGQTSYNKGDWLVASSASVLSKLAIGANNQVPVADSTQAVGIRWGDVPTATTIQNQQYTYGRASFISASVYALPINPIPSALSDGQGFVVKFPVTNTSSALSLTVSSLLAARIKNTDGTDPIVGAIKSSMIGIVEFDSVSSVFQLQNTYVPTYGTDTSKFLRNDGQFASIAAVTFKNGTATKDMSSSSVQAIAHGLTGNPKVVRITALAKNATANQPPGLSFLTYNGTTASNVYSYTANTGGNFDGVGSTLLVSNTANDGNNMTGVVTFDTSNININWVRNGTPSGTVQMKWEAEN